MMKFGAGLARLFVLVFFSGVVAFLIVCERPVDDFVTHIVMIAVGFFFGKSSNGVSSK